MYLPTVKGKGMNTVRIEPNSEEPFWELAALYQLKEHPEALYILAKTGVDEFLGSVYSLVSLNNGGVWRNGTRNINEVGDTGDFNKLMNTVIVTEQEPFWKVGQLYYERDSPPNYLFVYMLTSFYVDGTLLYALISLTDPGAVWSPPRENIEEVAESYQFTKISPGSRVVIET